MSVLIKGMEMPKGKAIAVVIHPDGTAYSAEMFAGVCTKYLTDCEAIPVPEHGRLIEAEPIMKYIADGLNSGEFGYDQIKVLSEIQYAPTIIPADDA